MPDESLPKAQRLHGTLAVAAVFGQGKGLTEGCLRIKYLFREDEGPARMLVSVPKRHFKRAVKRNLLKRRIREAFRRQKGLLPPGVDVLFIYIGTEVLPYEVIYAHVGAALAAISSAGRFRQDIDNQ